MERLFTIGAYGWEPEPFFAALQGAQVDLFLDLRRRRGVRGSQYAFANATRLQQELETRGIEYRHVLDLAPQPETRELQNAADLASKKPKRQRSALAGEFVKDYTRRTLEPFDWDAFVQELDEVRRPALFCVEREPVACHRHLVANRLVAATGVAVTDLVP